MSDLLINILRETNEPKEKAVKDNLIVSSKIKDLIREAGLRSDGELTQAISDKVHEMLSNAMARCRSNNRGTVRPCDL